MDTIQSEAQKINDWEELCLQERKLALKKDETEAVQKGLERLNEGIQENFFQGNKLLNRYGELIGNQAEAYMVEDVEERLQHRMRRMLEQLEDHREEQHQEIRRLEAEEDTVYWQKKKFLQEKNENQPE